MEGPAVCKGKGAVSCRAEETSPIRLPIIVVLFICELNNRCEMLG